MGFTSIFRNIFGFPDRKPPEDFESSDQGPRGNDFRNPIWNLDDDDDEDDDFRHNSRNVPGRNFSFHIFTNPLEIHRFFEHQMEQILRSFNDPMNELPPNFGHGFPALEHPEGNSDLDEGSGRHLRDKYLKPEYNIKERLPALWSSKDKMTDTDLDERIKSDGLNSIFRDHQQPVPSPRQFQTFNGTFTSRTIKRPDGTLEHHHTLRDSQGNEETTVTRQVGDQSYSVTTKRNSAGVEERTENLVNIDEGNLPEFEKKWGSGLQVPNDKPSHPHSWFPFDKFFPLN